jgi:hypothetical protein
MQNYATHRRFNPPYHFIMVPIFLANFVMSAVHLVRQPSWSAAWMLVLAFGVVLMAGLVRTHAITVQDRIIRLEERLRLQALAPELVGNFDRLDKRQLAALRFASDAELPALARRVLAGELVTGDTIKRAVTQWRADHLRV